MRNLYAGQEVTVRTGHGTTDWFQIRKGKKWAKSQTMTTPDASGVVEQQKLLFVAGRSTEW